VILEKLVDAGFAPVLCVEERSDVSAKRCAWYRKQLNLADAMPATVEEIRAIAPFERLMVEDMNNEDAKKALASANLDVIFLGGAGIVNEDVYTLAQFGCLNTHPGMLPHIRGSLPVAQSIVRDIPLGVTLHRVTDVLDCGGWVHQRNIAVTRDSTFEQLISESCEVAGDLFVFAAEQIQAEGRILEEEELPMSAFGPNLKWDKGIEAEARTVLKAGSYAHNEEERSFVVDERL
jgi:methionyl-tRNA formyltransferase